MHFFLQGLLEEEAGGHVRDLILSTSEDAGRTRHTPTSLAILQVHTLCRSIEKDSLLPLKDTRPHAGFDFRQRVAEVFVCWQADLSKLVVSYCSKALAVYDVEKGLLQSVHPLTQVLSRSQWKVSC